MFEILDSGVISQLTYRYKDLNLEIVIMVEF